MTALTAHFSLAELDGAAAPAEVRARLQQLAELLERVRVAAGNHPITVTSGYRSPAHNAAVPGAAEASEHMTGAAADFYIPALGRLEQAEVLKAAAKAGQLGAFGQLIVYPYTTGHAHISVADGRRDGEVLTKLVEGYRREFWAPLAAAAEKAAAIVSENPLRSLGLGVGLLLGFFFLSGQKVRTS